MINISTIAGSFYLVCALFLSALPGCTPFARGQTFNFQSYTTRDGLPSNLVSAIFQDSRGLLWFGTKSGLVVYDGAEFTTYSVNHGLPNNWVTAITERPDGSGTLIIGTIAGGLCELRQGVFHQLTHEGNVNTVHVDSSGALWFIMNDSLFRHQKGILRLLAVSSLYPNKGEILELSGHHRLVVGFGDELLTFSPDGTRLATKSMRDFGDIHAMAKSPDGKTLWLTGIKGNLRRVDWSGNTLNSYELSEREPSTLALDRLGQLWLRTVKGLYPVPSDAALFDPESKVYEITDIRPGGWVGPFMFDREDNLWAGTWAEGLLKVADRRVVRYPVKGIFGAVEDANGNIWVTTSSRILCFSRRADASWVATSYFGDSKRTWRGWPVVDSRGRLWVTETPHERAEFVGFHIRPQENRAAGLVQFARIPLQLGTAAWFIDRNDRFWIPTGDSGLKIIDSRTHAVLRTLDARDGVPHGGAKVFFQDREGNLWVGFWHSGLVRCTFDSTLTKFRFRLFTARDGLPHEGIRALHQDADGNLWIGTRHGGLARLDTHGIITSVSMKTGLRNNSVWRITTDTHGRVWLLTDAGVECVEASTLKPLPIQYKLIGQSPLDLGIHRENFLWLASSDGFSTFDFGKSKLAPPPPIVQVMSFHVNHSPRTISEPATLSHDENHCMIGFAGFGFSDERNMRYQYRLLGLDNTWSAPVTQRAITYAALNPGNYTFEVVALTSEGVASAEPARLQFSISPPLYRQWWFLALAAAIIGVIGWQVYRYRIRRVLELERLRMRIATDLHDEVGTNLSGILVSTQILERRLRNTLPDPDREHIREIGSVAQSTQEMMRDIVWMLNPSHDRFGDLVLKMKGVAASLLGNREYEFHVSPEDSPDTLSIDFKRNVFLIYKEALNNIVRHSSATRVVIDIKRQNGSFTFRISDNGKGFDTSIAETGSGLSSMRRRADHLPGILTVQSSPGEGTTISLRIKNNAMA